MKSKVRSTPELWKFPIKFLSQLVLSCKNSCLEGKKLWNFIILMLSWLLYLFKKKKKECILLISKCKPPFSKIVRFSLSSPSCYPNYKTSHFPPSFLCLCSSALSGSTKRHTRPQLIFPSTSHSLSLVRTTFIPMIFLLSTESNTALATASKLRKGC